MTIVRAFIRGLMIGTVIGVVVGIAMTAVAFVVDWRTDPMAPIPAGRLAPWDLRRG